MLRAVIALFDDMEILDFAGPLEVLSAATDQQGRPCFQTALAAQSEEVICRGGLIVRGLADLSALEGCDVFIVPGGPGARSEHGQPAVAAAARRQAASGAVVASVCTGAFILAQAGLLDGLEVTTHSARLADLAGRYPALKVVGGKVVDRGKIITAGGVASGVDLGLHLLERFFGPLVRSKEAQRLDGPWQ